MKHNAGILSIIALIFLGSCEPAGNASKATAVPKNSEIEFILISKLNDPQDKYYPLRWKLELIITQSTRAEWVGTIHKLRVESPTRFFRNHEHPIGSRWKGVLRDPNSLPTSYFSCVSVMRIE